jgi:co-chaperonin GroES (HSP10)
MTLKPIKNTFIFKFLDSINSNGQFNKTTTEAGIILQANFDDSAKEARWVKIDTAGPECESLDAGDVVLLPALRWTSGVKFEDEKVWKSDEKQAVIVLESSKMIPLRDIIIFKKVKDEESLSTFGLVLVKDPHNNSPRGYVVATGPDCVDIGLEDTIYYDDSQFTDAFTHNGTEYGFIKEDNVLAFA